MPVGAMRMDALEQLSGRPRNSPGWGRLVAVKDAMILTSNGDYAIVEAGRDRVAPDSSYAQDPEVFRPVDSRDKRTAALHRANLERAMRRVEAELRNPPRRTYGLGAAKQPRTWELDAKRPRRNWALPDSRDDGATRFRESLLTLDDAATSGAGRSPIAHIAVPHVPRRALCGAPMQGIPAPAAAKRCSKCAELWAQGGTRARE